MLVTVRQPCRAGEAVAVTLVRVAQCRLVSPCWRPERWQSDSLWLLCALGWVIDSDNSINPVLGHEQV
jgi:hypothetical protein